MRRVLCSLILVFWATAAFAQGDLWIPDGYVVQKLEPVGGQIARPKDWHFQARTIQNGWVWTISAEDPTTRYDTGWRGQVLMGVAKATNRSVREYALKFLQDKKGSVNQVVRECPLTETSVYSLGCIEVVEGRHRILYTVFWGAHDFDMVFISMFGAPESEWQTAKSKADVMSSFILMSSDFIERVKSRP